MALAGGWDGTAPTSPAWQPSSWHLYAHHQFHLSEFVELSLLSVWRLGKQQDAEKSERVRFSPVTHCGILMSLSRATHVSQATDQPSGAGGGARGFPVPGAGGSHTHSPVEEG